MGLWALITLAIFGLVGLAAAFRVPPLPTVAAATVLLSGPPRPADRDDSLAIRGKKLGEGGIQSLGRGMKKPRL